MTPTDPDWRAWAREQLELGEAVPSDEARRAFLQRLNDEDFLPPESLPYALTVLEGRAGPPGVNEDAVGAEFGDRRRQRVEEFARTFFQIPIDRRREQWLHWKAECEDDAALTNRLDRLEPGLALDPNGLAPADPNVRKLIQEASKIFVLRPFEAAQARAAFFRRDGTQTPDGMIQWAAAARMLKRTYPRYEALAPELIQQVIRWPVRAKQLERQRRRPQATRPGSRVTKVLPPPPASAPTAEPFYDPNKKKLYVGLILVIVAMCVGIRATTRPHSSAPPPVIFQPSELGKAEERFRQLQQMPDEQQKVDAILRFIEQSREESKQGNEGLPPKNKAKAEPAVPSGKLSP